MNGTANGRLHVLVVDDEPPVLADLADKLADHPSVAVVLTAADSAGALQVLSRGRVDAVFLDIHMPGLDGVELARALRRFAAPPAVVFVTAFEEHALQAFEVDAIDYLLKPVRPERLDTALSRVRLAIERSRVGPAREGARPGAPGAGGPAAAGGSEHVTIPVERGGRTRLVDRAEIDMVEAEGDYVRLHLRDSSYLVRVPLSQLEQEWADAGFLRVHRSFLVNMQRLEEVRTETQGNHVARIGGRDVPVSRRGLRTIRLFLADAARIGGLAQDSHRS
jgi:DNA-binding LytR/AlgR family response regulator